MALGGWREELGDAAGDRAGVQCRPGKPEREGGYPAIFVAGVAAGATGIYRSTDGGKRWDRIGQYPLGIFDWIDAMDGDKDVFGKVYIAFSGPGLPTGNREPPGSRAVSRNVTQSSGN